MIRDISPWAYTLPCHEEKKKVYAVKGIVKEAQLGCVKNQVEKATSWPKKMKSTYMKDLSSLPAKCLEFHSLPVQFVATNSHLQGHNCASEQGIGFCILGDAHLEFGQ